MRERKMEKLQNRKYGSESIDVPMFIFFRNSSGQVEIIKTSCKQRQDQIWICFIQIWKPQHAGSFHRRFLVRYFPYGHNHCYKDRHLNNITDVKLCQTCICLFLVIQNRLDVVVTPLGQSHLAVLENRASQSDVRTRLTHFVD